jgi:hypothetical protein
MIEEYYQLNQPVMWKNVFLESCLLSGLIFAGFYLNAAFLKDELYSENKKASSYLSHISGSGAPLDPPTHISGNKPDKESLSHISGVAKTFSSQQ